MIRPPAYGPTPTDPARFAVRAITACLCCAMECWPSSRPLLAWASTATPSRQAGSPPWSSIWRTGDAGTRRLRPTLRLWGTRRFADGAIPPVGPRTRGFISMPSSPGLSALLKGRGTMPACLSVPLKGRRSFSRSPFLLSAWREPVPICFRNCLHGISRLCAAALSSSGTGNSRESELKRQMRGPARFSTPPFSTL